MYRRGLLILPEEDDAAALYTATAEAAAAHGLEQYEISNYARPGSQSRHNLTYWRYGDYAGVGPGAHGRLSIAGQLVATRRHRAPEPWAERVEQHGHGSTAEESLAAPERGREMLLMGLRLAEGICLPRFTQRTGLPLEQAVDTSVLQQALEAGYLETVPGRLVATSSGRLRLDALLTALLL